MNAPQHTAHPATGAIEMARRVLRIEADAVAALADRVAGEFEQAIELILRHRGKR